MNGRDVMIRVRGVSKSFGDQVVLRDFTLSVGKGETLALLGESGSGKSVLLRHLVGLERPDSGSVCVGGTEVTALTEARLLRFRRRIGFLFQDGALYDFLTVFENVAFPLQEHTHLRPSEIREKVMGILEEVGLGGAADKRPDALSGGMRKRAALARAVVLESEVLLCDEPTSGLDPIKSREIMDLIRRIAHRTRATTVITSHDVAQSLRIADRAALLREGRVAACGRPACLREDTDPFVRAFLGKEGA